MKMLGRKQSIKQENILADYGNEEMMNENADVEWVNKVRHLLTAVNVMDRNFSPFSYGCVG